MKGFYIILLLIFLLLFSACGLDDEPASVARFTNDLCFKNALDAGYVYRNDGKIWLRGDVEEDEFDISNWSLKACQLNLGLGKEYYDALIEPEYLKASEIANDYMPGDTVIVLKTKSFLKVFPYELVRKHELINDIVDGHPVMIHYSLLTKIGVVYNRHYCDTTFTFAVSGYTYWDADIGDAVSSFILWDRETESLWWPMINKSVSGQMKGTWLVKYDETQWWKTTWEDVLSNFPEADVLKADQTMASPDNWPRYSDVGCK